MKTPDIPSPEVVIAEIAPLLRAVFGALESGTQGAREFFDTRGSEVDPFLAPSLVRWLAKQYLDEAGHDVSELPYDRENLANNGLCLSTEGYAIRILKAGIQGRPPVPGPSRTRQAFYSQQPYLFPDMKDEEEPKWSPLNLLLPWDTNAEFSLKGLTLACPRSGETTRESVECFWVRTLEHPAVALPTAQPSVPDEDLDLRLDIGEDQAGAEPSE